MFSTHSEDTRPIRIQKRKDKGKNLVASRELWGAGVKPDEGKGRGEREREAADAKKRATDL